MSTVTHEVLNQPTPLQDINPFEGHLCATRCAACLGSTPPAWRPRWPAAPRCSATRAWPTCTRPSCARTTALPPVDEVEFHPSYHALMSAATAAGLMARRTRPTRRPAATPLCAQAFMMFTELEPSILCPISMTYAVTPALRDNPAIYRDWSPQLTSRAYDPVLRLWRDKPGVTMGMGMTEKQGGSDVRANTTQALPDGHDDWGARYRLTGHKWFMSAPMCDAFLVLAQSAGGLSCFFLPRVLPDGTRNVLRIQRLKDKLGNKANASPRLNSTLRWPGWWAKKGAACRRSWPWA